MGASLHAFSTTWFASGVATHADDLLTFYLEGGLNGQRSLSGSILASPESRGVDHHPADLAGCYFHLLQNKRVYSLTRPGFAEFNSKMLELRKN